MIGSLLIANRGEIARRVIRTARAMNIRTIAVHSDVDAALPFVREADEAVCIGPAPARDSYLDQAKILAAARQTGAEAIHPGYGFLSENADFADAVIAAGLVWVGAPPAAIRAMGLKDAAKALMAAAGVPVTPGYLGEDQAPDRLRAEADAIGYPVLIKAVAGGGGKGMRRVEGAEEFADALVSCRREAAAAFGDDRVLIEKYVLNPRHIEVQVFGDTHGQVVHLFERDCSLQRRHQKVIEEAPAPGMDEATRAAICDAAVKAAKAVAYVGAGTIEFIADASEGLRADRIWFMEMNTRLQVEHPVTEAITGQDLVEWQLRVAGGEPLPRQQHELSIHGWAMEARLYAEDPAKGFLPSTGKLDIFVLPGEGLRIDAGVEAGSIITPFYDPMIAKVIAHEADRGAAAARLRRGLEGTLIHPVRTNAGFLARLLGDEAFLAGRVDTGLIGRDLDQLAAVPPVSEAGLQRAAALLCGHDAGSAAATPWNGGSGFRLNAGPECRIRLEVDGVRQELAWSDTGAGVPAHVDEDGVHEDGVHADGVIVGQAGEPHRVRLWRGRGEGKQSAGQGSIAAPMPGRIVSVDVAQGMAVKAGQRLLVLEAMKMEQALLAPFDGIVTALRATPGAQVSEGTLLVRVEPGEA